MASALGQPGDNRSRSPERTTDAVRLQYQPSFQDSTLIGTEWSQG